MAKHQPRIAVRVNGATHHYIGRAAALALIAAGWSKWLEENRAVEMLARNVTPIAQPQSKMPPVEVGGCRFRAPQGFQQRAPRFHRCELKTKHGLPLTSDERRYEAGDPRN